MQKTGWKESVVYQIYPRSFKDSNGDGIGDLRGILSKLDYLQELGVDVIWLSPVYQSPNEDNGYDISDYEKIMDEFGTMDDWKELLSGLHDQGMKLIMDLVVNHTSSEHQWFQASRESTDNPYRDYYFWRPGKDGREPNNWSSVFGGSAWQWDEQTQQFYLHIFGAGQPDLNWDNPKLRDEIFAMMRRWLDRGIDGFRMDVINFISKAEGLPNASGDGQYEWGGAYFMNGPHIHDYLQEMNQKVLSQYDQIMSVGEMPGVTPEEALLYVGEDRHELNMVFQFEHMELDQNGAKWNIKPWSLADLKQVMGKWQQTLQGKGWNSLYLNNHDQPRMVSRFGDEGRYRVESAKLLATFLHTLQGTPFIYQGEELGMTNVKFQKIDDYRDIETLHWYKEAIASGWKKEDALHAIHAKGRDNARTPVQWNDSDHAGFTSGTPWIEVNSNYPEINAEKERRDPNSVLNYYKSLIALRKQNPIMIYGDYQPLLEEHEQVYAYVRHWENQRWLVLLNFSQESADVQLPEELTGSTVRRMIGNYEYAEEAAKAGAGAAIGGRSESAVQADRSAVSNLNSSSAGTGEVPPASSGAAESSEQQTGLDESSSNSSSAASRNTAAPLERIASGRTSAPEQLLPSAIQLQPYEAQVLELYVKL